MDSDVESSLFLPTKIMNELKCSECLNYLSVKPIMISKGKKILCGRCTYKFQNEYCLTYSLYNYIAETCFFNCINYYDGCEALLTMKNTIEHESTCCFNKIHECFLCSYKGNACQIKNHIEIEHSGNVIDDGIFCLPTEDTDDVLFFFSENNLVKIDLQIYRDQFKLSSCLINPSSKNNCGISYSLRFFNPKYKVKFLFDPIQFLNVASDLSENRFEIKLCDLVELFPSRPIFVSIVINTDQDMNDQKYTQMKIALKKQENTIKKEQEKLMLEKLTLSNPYNILKKLIDLYMRSTITCQNCSKEVQEKSDILICPQVHIACLKCTKNYCIRCTTDCQWVAFKELLKDLEFQCEWTNCPVKTKAWEFIQHKQLCINRQYKCPSAGCDFFGKKHELTEHWHCKVELQIGGNVDFEGQNVMEMYWITDYLNELLHVRVDVVGLHFNVIVSEEFVIYPNNYILELHRVRDDNCYSRYGFLVQYPNYKARYNCMPVHYDCRLVFTKK